MTTRAFRPRWLRRPPDKLLLIGIILLASLYLAWYMAAPADRYSEDFITRKIYAVQYPETDVPGGFLILPIERFRDMQAASPEIIDRAYRSNPGWYGLLLATIYRVGFHSLGIAPDAFLVILWIANALFLAGVVFAISRVIGRRLGNSCARLALLIYALLLPPLHYMGVNLYWGIPYMLLAPLLAGAFIVRGDKFAATGTIFGVGVALTLVKIAYGYEWITTFFLNNTIFIVFALVINRTPLRQALRVLVALAVGSLFGFALGFGLHVAQGWLTYGSFAAGINPILSRAVAHSGDAQAAGALYPTLAAVYPNARDYIDLVLKYFGQWIIPIALIAYLSSIALTWVFRRRLRDLPTLIALHAAAFVTWAGAFSWIILMRSHAFVHVYQNQTLFTIYPVPLSLVGLALIVMRLRATAAARPIYDGA